MTWPPKSPNGYGWWKAKSRTYYTRKPGWAVEDLREVKRRLTDWQFISAHGGSIPAWMRPDYKSRKAS